LYVGLGDGGSGGDPCGRAQTLAPATLNQTGNCAVDANFTAVGGNADSRALLGKMLRLNVDATTPAGHSLCGVPSTQAALYAAPAANAFTPAGACGEVFAYGLRNPWRFSFDRQTGDLLIGDVGQNAFEEINFQKRELSGSLRSGLNYGWNCWEGETGFNGCGTPALNTTHDPVTVYGRSLGQSITGGYVYRGAINQFQGLYFYADFAFDNLFVATPASLTLPGTTQANWSTVNFSSASLGNTIGNVSSFGENDAGELLIVGYGGSIYQFEQGLGNGFE
jgi:glucose/arabinose dehydrogenase